MEKREYKSPIAIASFLARMAELEADEAASLARAKRILGALQQEARFAEAQRALSAAELRAAESAKAGAPAPDPTASTWSLIAGAVDFAAPPLRQDLNQQAAAATERREGILQRVVANLKQQLERLATTDGPMSREQADEVASLIENCSPGATSIRADPLSDGVGPSERGARRSRNRRDRSAPGTRSLEEAPEDPPPKVVPSESGVSEEGDAKDQGLSVTNANTTRRPRVAGAR